MMNWARIGTHLSSVEERHNFDMRNRADGSDRQTQTGSFFSPPLRTIDSADDAGDVYLGVDSSREG